MPLSTRDCQGTSSLAGSHPSAPEFNSGTQIMLRAGFQSLGQSVQLKQCILCKKPRGICISFRHPVPHLSCQGNDQYVILTSRGPGRTESNLIGCRQQVS